MNAHQGKRSHIEHENDQRDSRPQAASEKLSYLSPDFHGTIRHMAYPRFGWPMVRVEDRLGHPQGAEDLVPDLAEFGGLVFPEVEE